MSGHGSRTTYSQGCRCVECTAANRAYLAAYRAGESWGRPLRRPSVRWMDQAACRELDPDLFFPGLGRNDTVEEAKAVCATCPVKAPCLEHALTHTEGRYGIWGGESEHDRRRIKRARKAKTPTPALHEA